MDNGFWTFNIGHVAVLISLASLLLTLHRSNTKRIEDGTRKLTEMETKLDLVYEWFKENVVGRGEPHRKEHGGD